MQNHFVSTIFIVHMALPTYSMYN